MQEILANSGTGAAFRPSTKLRRVRTILEQGGTYVSVSKFVSVCRNDSGRRTLSVRIRRSPANNSVGH